MTQSIHLSSFLRRAFFNRIASVSPFNFDFSLTCSWQLINLIQKYKCQKFNCSQSFSKIVLNNTFILQFLFFFWQSAHCHFFRSIFNCQLLFCLSCSTRVPYRITCCFILLLLFLRNSIFKHINLLLAS